MNIQFAPDSTPPRRVNIKVVGVGGAGGNAVDRMIENGLSEVDFYAVNTDGQALDRSRAHQTLVIGNQLTRGLGAGGDPEIGRRAAEEDREVLAALVEDADMVFVTAGMGGGTGTGAAPVVAEVARASGALTVAVVTRPFLFEGFRRMEQAEAGLAALREHTDALLVIPNERLMEIDLPDGAMTEVFGIADNVLYEATRGISDIIAQHAVVNLDFADVRTVMQDSGAAIMGTGRAEGEDRASVAARKAINSPLLENVDIHGSRAVLVYLTAGNVGRDDLRGAMGYIQQAAGAEAHVFFGFANEESLGDALRVTVIATGFPAGSTDGQPREQESRTTAVAEAPAEAAPETAEAAPGTTEAGVEPAEIVPESAEVALAPERPAAEPLEPSAAIEPEPEPEPAPAGEPAPGFLRDEQQPDPTPEPAPELPDPGLAAEAPPSAALSPAPADPPEPAREDACFEEAASPEIAAPAPHQRLAALAAAAGGLARTVDPQPGGHHRAGAADAAPPDELTAPPGPPHQATAAPREPSETSRRFLDPLGSVPLEDDQRDVRPPAGQRFRSSVLGEDRLRPAWERKYVD